MKMLTTKQLNQRIKTLGSQTAKRRTAIHDLTLQSVVHYAEHGNSTPMTNLVNAVRKSEALQLRSAITAVAPVSWFDGAFKNTQVKFPVMAAVLVEDLDIAAIDLCVNGLSFFEQPTPELTPAAAKAQKSLVDRLTAAVQGAESRTDHTLSEKETELLLTIGQLLGGF